MKGPKKEGRMRHQNKSFGWEVKGGQLIGNQRHTSDS